MSSLNIPAPRLELVGYGGWSTPVRIARLISALGQRGVTRLVDVRLNPCSSDPKPGRYGPKPWNLQPGRDGIVGVLETAEIAYEWIVELGNPQRHDRSMTVLRSHLADPDAGWPIHRGLDRLAALVRTPGAVVALLCACGDERACHRSVIARALAQRDFEGRISIRDIRSGRAVDPMTVTPL